ncbi:MAG TPA: cation-transporting P-type ATPase [Pyrinomonadaceae bacterium]|nr:cation-transporting P-type ATPase [Pyrinomonadaceae bacterium]
MSDGVVNRKGLSTAEAQALLRTHGPNLLPEKKSVTLLQRFLNQFRSALIYVLIFALAVDLTVWVVEGAAGIPLESIAIGLILVLNAGLGVYQESKAETALARLNALAESYVWVLRDGQMVHLPSARLVPGDVVRLEAGDRLPADGNLIEAQGAMIDESVLTGESVPVEKAVGDEAFSGTLLTRGKTYVQVTRTGVASAAGKLAELIGKIKPSPTPLERRLSAFGNQVARWVLILAVVVAIAGTLIEGISRAGHVLLFAVALAVAAVPEGLPAVLTLTLALGVERMAKQKAVVRRLSAVEALGSVTVIATDKTGTLTENRMYVKDVDTPHTKRALRAMALANDAETSIGAGDPLELALIDYVEKQDLAVESLRNAHPRKSVLPFDSAHKFMRVTVAEDGDLVSYLKGAPEVIIARSRLGEADRQSWEEKATGYATEGFRLLALAWRQGEGDVDVDFLGLVLLWDPPRAEVPEAIKSAREAGIRVVMITGDHPATALAVASEVGIPPGRVVTGVDLKTFSTSELTRAVKEANVFARVAPEDKLKLVEALTASGEIVAVTGDGVNDAPALKRSDVGVAMGRRGSDVSREVADLVLLDDNFATIVSAIREGRNIYENIQKFIRFLFSTNLSETLIVVMGLVGAFMMGLHDESGALLLPLTASQLLWINIVTDGPGALALGLDRDPAVLQQKPRNPSSRLLDEPSLRFILISGIFKALVGCALLLTLPMLGHSIASTRTSLFLYMSIGQLMFLYPARHVGRAEQTNIAVHLAVVAGIGLQLLTVFVPALRVLLRLEKQSLQALLMVGGLVLLTWTVAESYSRLSLRNRSSA